MASLLMKSKSDHSEVPSSLQRTMLIILLALNVVFAEDNVEINLVLSDSDDQPKPTLEVSGLYQNLLTKSSRNYLKYDEDFAKNCYFHNSSNTLGRVKIPYPDNVYFTNDESGGLFNKYKGPNITETKLIIEPTLKKDSLTRIVRRGPRFLECSKDNLKSDKPDVITCDISQFSSVANSIKSSHEVEAGAETEAKVGLDFLVNSKIKLSLKYKYGRAEEHTVTNSSTFTTPHKGVVPPRKYSIVTFQMVTGVVQATIRSLVGLTGNVMLTFKEPFENHNYHYVPARGLDYCAGQMNRFVDERYTMEYLRTLETKQRDYNQRPTGDS